MLDGLGLFQLGDDPGFAAEADDAIAHQTDVFGGADKRNRNRINAVLQSELKIDLVFRGQGRNTDFVPGRLIP